MAENLHIVGRSSHLGVIQKTYNWQVRIPKPTGVNSVEWVEQGLPQFLEVRLLLLNLCSWE